MVIPILNYTTEVSATRSLSEIQQLLAKNGAQRVSVDYDTKGEPAAVEFEITVYNQPVHYRLPCNTEGVLRAMVKGKAPRRYQRHQQAQRAAWRIIKNWVDVQLALVESNQVEMAEVFLPYAIDAKGETMYALFKESKQKQLGARGGT